VSVSLVMAHLLQRRIERQVRPAGVTMASMRTP